MATSFLIYALVDPRDGEIRYIGKSSTGLKRPNTHMNANKLARDRTDKAGWLKALVLVGLRCEIRILERLEHGFQLDESERRWIAHGRANGWKLTNMTDGGDGLSGRVISEEVRARIREEWITGKRKHSPETIEKLRALKTGVARSEETKEKIRLKLLGRKPTAEARSKMSKARIGKPPNNAGKPISEETRFKLSESHKNLPPRSKEWREKISIAQRGRKRPELAERNRSPEMRAITSNRCKGVPRPEVGDRNRSPEQRAAVSRALKGRVFSEETLAKMRAGQQRRHARKRALDKDPSP